MSISRETTTTMANSMDTDDTDLMEWLDEFDFGDEANNTPESMVIDSQSTPEVTDVTNDGTFGPNTRSDGKNKLYRFILTFFPPDANMAWLAPERYFKNPKSMFDLWVGQYEICPTTGKLHCHIYVETNRKNAPRFCVVDKAIRKFHKVNIKLSRKSSPKQRQCAINYVVSEAKRAPGTNHFLWSGNKFQAAFDASYIQKPKRNSKKAKDEVQEEQRLWIESKPRHWQWDQIVHESEESKKLLFGCSAGEKYHKGRHAEDPRKTITNVIILYGAGGTGKTTHALAYGVEKEPIQECRYYRRNPDDGAFWGGGRTCYKGQPVIHYEEFTGQEAFSRLKEVCDIGKHGPAVNVKNGGAILNHETVIFTSNVHPAGWFHNLWDKDPKQWMPFNRRITEVRFYPAHRSDGRLNAPDEENPPYFIDQTKEFHEFAGDYNQALLHAEQNWPLREEPEPQPIVFVQGKSRTTVTNPFYDYCVTGADPLKGKLSPS